MMGSKAKICFKLGLYNPGSLGTGQSDFLVAMDNLKCDIVAINETWIKKGDEARAPKVPGYSFRNTPRPESMGRSRGGGVGFYVRRGIKAQKISHPDANIEQMWLSVTINRLKLAIGTAYRPEWVNVDNFFDALTESVAYFGAHDHVIVLGDFNIDCMCPHNLKYLTLEQFLDCTGLSQVVTSSPTHYTDHSQTLIDVICTDCNVRDVSVIDIKGKCGHSFVTTTLNIKREKIPPRTIVCRSLKSIDHKKFDEDILALDWSHITQACTVDTMVDVFTSLVTALLDKHAPIKTIKIKDKCTPWITDVIKTMIKCRNEAHDKFRTTKLEIHKKHYKELKSFVSRSIYNETRAYYDYRINSEINNEKRLWKNLKDDVLHASKTFLPDIFDQPDDINNHFLNIPGSTDIPMSNRSFFELNKFNNATFSLHEVDEQEVAKILLNIKTNARGVDDLSMDMVLLTLPHTLSLITGIVNKSITTSTFPSQWKIAKINPIPKISHPTDLKDLRPISILPVLSKVLEKVVYSQLSGFIERNKILPDVQSGFRGGRGTTTALLDVVDNILAEQDQGLGTILVLLDFSRAFDSISIPLLLSKLSYYGVDATAIGWFESYLSNRSQFVQITKEDGTQLSSSCKSVVRGVPQGSILGPLLFIIYSADICWQIKHCKYHIYADDVQLYLPVDPGNVLCGTAKLNDDLGRIADWSNKNALLLNPLKSKFMILGSPRLIEGISTISPNINIHGQSIERAREARNLGLLLDDTLRFENHIKSIARNCLYRLKLLYKVKNFLRKEIRVKVCESIVLSKLNYGDLVYGPRLLSRTARLVQRVQNACCRFCYDIPPRTHVTPYINNSSTLNMASRRHLHLAVLVHDVVKFESPEYLFSKLSSVKSKYSLRPSRRNLLHYSNYKTVAFRGSFRYQATKCWNNIPPPLRLLKSKFTFKIRFKSYLLEHQKTGLPGAMTRHGTLFCC